MRLHSVSSEKSLIRISSKLGSTVRTGKWYRKVGLFRKHRVNMQRPISAKRNAWEGNFTSLGVLNLGNLRYRKTS